MANDYDPRYQVGDRIGDGFGNVWMIKEVERARTGDGFSSPRAIEKGFTVYRMQPLTGEGRSAVIATAFLHYMIDDAYLQWAYLGPDLDGAADDR